MNFPFLLFTTQIFMSKNFLLYMEAWNENRRDNNTFLWLDKTKEEITQRNNNKDNFGISSNEKKQNDKEAIVNVDYFARIYCIFEIDIWLLFDCFHKCDIISFILYVSFHVQSMSQYSCNSIRVFFFDFHFFFILNLLMKK